MGSRVVGIDNGSEIGHIKLLRNHRSVMPYQPIENYGVIGDLETVALVSKEGSIDFMCFPYFDSPSIFAALLDHEKGGRFQVAPMTQGLVEKQLYLPDSNILMTRFLGDCGICEISDFMVIEEKEDTHTLIRRAKSVRGDIDFWAMCDPKFDYGRCPHKIHKGDGEVLFIPDNPKFPTLRLIADIPLHIHENGVIADFVLREGETVSFILELADPNKPTAYRGPENLIHAFKSTMNFWQRWVARSTYRGRWREHVDRSALTLKLLTSKRHGSMVASPTFGLPEEIGGVRNWDYRYTWIRDASFTLYALMRLGYTEESAAFMHWIEERCSDLNPDGSMQIMYGLDGRKVLVEEELTHLEGYRGSRPVRIGNAAHSQLQLDIYGELMDSVYLYNKYGEPISLDLWENLKRLINWVCENWKQKDEGIWEVRGGKKHFLYSRLMCWVAVDRAIRLSHKRSLPAPLEKWYLVRDAIHREIVTDFWNPQIKAFVQYKGASTLDAANLLMPLVKFVGPTDPKWLSTLRAMEETLVDDSLVFRYRMEDAAHDGLEGGEGTFNMCSFWFVECLSRAGDVKQARFFFEKMLGYSNHLGLYAEELGPGGSHLGNFPQAFTHLALISAAYNLDLNLSSHRIHW